MYSIIFLEVMLRLHWATFSPRPYYVLKNKDAVRTWYGLVGRGRNVVRTWRGLDIHEGLGGEDEVEL